MPGWVSFQSATLGQFCIGTNTVAPLVKTRSSSLPSIRPATWARALSTAHTASSAKVWRRYRIHGRTRRHRLHDGARSTGVVALSSRHAGTCSSLLLNSPSRSHELQSALHPTARVHSVGSWPRPARRIQPPRGGLVRSTDRPLPRVSLASGRAPTGALRQPRPALSPTFPLSLL